MVAFLRRNQVLLSSGCFLLISLFLLSVNTGQGRRRIDPLGTLLLEVMYPLQLGVSVVITQTGRLWHGYFSLVAVQQENQRLRRSIEELEEIKAKAAELRFANKRLQRLLQFRKGVQGRVVTAEIAGQSVVGWSQAVTINRGERNGVHKGMAVMCPQGVVGQVVLASPHAARVLLITDHNSGVGALVQRTRVRGIVEGTVEEECLLKYVRRNEDVRVGDTIITSGLDGIFPKGHVIGRVVEVEKGQSGLFQFIKVLPSVDFARLEEVLVVDSYPTREKGK